MKNQILDYLKRLLTFSNHHNVQEKEKITFHKIPIITIECLSKYSLQLVYNISVQIGISSRDYLFNIYLQNNAKNLNLCQETIEWECKRLNSRQATSVMIGSQQNSLSNDQNISELMTSIKNHQRIQLKRNGQMVLLFRKDVQTYLNNLFI